MASEHKNKNWNSCRKEWERKPLFSGRGHLLAVPTSVLSLLLPLSSGHQEGDTLGLALFLEYHEEKYSSS